MGHLINDRLPDSDRMTAAEIVGRIAEGFPKAAAAIRAEFDGVPGNAPVIFTKRLPLRADRFGMIGIVLFGTIYLLPRLRTYPPAEFLSILRHELEHVIQQRNHPATFYVRYLLQVILRYLQPASTDELRKLRARFGRAKAAYLTITFETEAYAVGEKTRAALQRLF